jgi:hypothetical protein
MARTRQRPPRHRGVEPATAPGLTPEEAAIECELTRERRLRQRKLLETKFVNGRVSYDGHGILCGLYVAAGYADDTFALDVAGNDAPKILARMTVPVLRDGTWTQVDITPSAYRYGEEFFERGIAWVQQREERARAKAKQAKSPVAA